MSMSNLVAILCTVAMVGAFIWATIMEHSGKDHAGNDVSDNKSIDNEEN